MDRGLDHWRTANETSLINGNRAWSWAKFTKYYNFKSISLCVCICVSNLSYILDGFEFNDKVASVMDELKEWRRKRECGSLKFVQVVVVRWIRLSSCTGSLVTELSRHNWSRVSLKGVHSRLMPEILVHLVFVRNSGFFFFFFENFCVANESDVSMKCYSNSVSVRFSLFLSLLFSLSSRITRMCRFFEYFWSKRSLEIDNQISLFIKYTS